MALGAAASVARNHPVVRPPHGLLVDELDGGIRSGLCVSSVRQLIVSPRPRSLIRLGPSEPQLARQHPVEVEPTCSSKSVCSNRGPVMATARGRWLRDQISARFGACEAAVGTAPSGTWGTLVSAVVGVVAEPDVADSNWRPVAVKDRFERCRGSSALGAAVRSRAAYIVWLWFGVVAGIGCVRDRTRRRASVN